MSNPNQIKIALISTYPKLSKVLENIAKREGVNFLNIFAAFEEAANLAKEIEPKVDAIISRGATAEYIRQVVDIPVICIPILPFDVVQSIYRVRSEVKEVAFFNHARKLYGIQEIEKILLSSPRTKGQGRMNGFVTVSALQ